MATQLKQPPHGSPAWFYTMVDAARTASAPTAHVVQLCPSLAQELLKQNPDNRSVRQTKLAQYSADMAAGKWTMNGEPIIISKDGQLNDGQHRCLAVIDANATVPALVVFGVERDTRLTVDQGGARSAGDFLGMEGVANASLVAAIARMVIAYERSKGEGLGGANHITSAEIRARVASDISLAGAATFGHTNWAYTRSFAAASIIGFAFYILARVDHSEARVFMERVSRGDGLKLKDPAHTVREKLRMDNYSRDRKIAMIFKAWNFHRRHMKVAAASLNSNLPFPALI